MRKLIFLLAFLKLSSMEAQENMSDSLPPKDTLKASEISQHIVQFLLDKDFDTIPFYFDERLKEKLNSSRLEKTLVQMESSFGKLLGPIDFGEIEKGGTLLYVQGLEFEKSKLNLQFQLNEDLKMSSFILNQYSYKNKWVVPSYVDTNLVLVEKLFIGDTLPLSAEVCLPKGVDNPPIVVLVHGSGPNNMNEQLGPNRIFKDIAYGLASNGIACLRYNKRSYEHPRQMAIDLLSLTIDMVVTDDAILALNAAQSYTEGNLIVAGHSLGGHMAPRIADFKKLDGVIVLAGNSSPMIDLLVPQYEYLRTNDTSQNINDIQMNWIKKQVENVKTNNYDSSTIGPTLPLGLPGNFWLSLKDYYPDSIASKQEQPYLILNGGRDYQVTIIEAKGWNNGNSNEKSKTIIYPSMNHLFFQGEGLCLPDEYNREASFDEQVINDMTNWIKSLED